jgi:uncharacterized coiled-coil protein SlyX
MTNAEKQAAFRARREQKAAADAAEIAALKDQLKARSAVILNMQHRLNGLATLLADALKREADAATQRTKPHDKQPR